MKRSGMVGALLLAIGVSVLAGCGGGDLFGDDPSATTGPEESAGPSVTGGTVAATTDGGELFIDLEITGGAAPDALVEASVPPEVASAAELRVTAYYDALTPEGEMTGGVMSDPTGRIEIPSGVTVRLGDPADTAQGIALVEPAGSLADAGEFPLTLRFAGSASLTVMVEVLGPTP